MEKPRHDWSSYHEETRERPPSETLISALSFTDRRDAALDFGAGSLRDSKFLAESGFKEVVAVDIQTSGVFVPERFSDIITLVPSTFEEFDFQNDHFDLVNAQYSLPFTSPDQYLRVFGTLTDSIKVRGIFVGQFFGKKDTWADRASMSFHSREEVEALLTQYEQLVVTEIDKDGLAASGEEKHWHVFNVIARKL